MLELQNSRTLTSKAFDLGGEKKQTEVHVGHIHYFDKLDSNKLRGIDHVLVWDDVKKGWGFKYHSYQPFFPEYADGEASFRDLFENKDQIIKYTALAGHVKGVLIETDNNNPFFDDNTDNKGVLYEGAFGWEKDMILYNTRSRMVKVATVNNPNDQIADVVFEWELEFPNKKVYRGLSSDDITYELDTSLDKEFDTSKQTLIGDSTNGYTYLKNYKAWDSDGNMTNITASLVHKFGKYILTKTIPLSFMQSAIGRVYTDTETTFFAGSGDGGVLGFTNTSPGTQSAWDAVHDQTTGQIAGDTDTQTDTFSRQQSEVIANGTQIGRSFYPFDTSSLPDGDTISAAIFTVTMQFTQLAGTTTSTFGVVETSQASTSAMVVADFDQCGAINNPTEGATRITFSSDDAVFIARSYTLDATGIGFIDATGVTKLGLRSGADMDDAFTTGYENRWAIKYSEFTGTADDPKLVVTHAAEAAGEGGVSLGANF